MDNRQNMASHDVGKVMSHICKNDTFCNITVISIFSYASGMAL